MELLGLQSASTLDEGGLLCTALLGVLDPVALEANVSSPSSCLALQRIEEGEEEQVRQAEDRGVARQDDQVSHLRVADRAQRQEEDEVYRFDHPHRHSADVLYKLGTD